MLLTTNGADRNAHITLCAPNNGTVVGFEDTVKNGGGTGSLSLGPPNEKRLPSTASTTAKIVNSLRDSAKQLSYKRNRNKGKKNGGKLKSSDLTLTRSLLIVTR